MGKSLLILLGRLNYFYQGYSKEILKGLHIKQEVGMMSLEIVKETINRTTTLEVIGLLDISTVGIIDPCIEEIDDIDTLIFDFTRLEFIDSTGIGSIMNVIYLSQERNFKVKLKGLNDLTHSIFETIGLYQILEAIQGEVM